MKKTALLIVALGLIAQPAAAAQRGSDGVNVFEREGHVWVADSRMHDERELVPGIDPAWSASASRIAFSFGGGIFTIRSDGGGTSQLTPAATNSRQPAWSPNGKSIAFSSDFGDYPRAQGIYVVRAGGTHLRRVTFLSQRGAHDVAPQFSPGGDSIVFTRTRTVKGGVVSATLVTTLRGRHVRRLTPWAPAE